MKNKTHASGANLSPKQKYLQTVQSRKDKRKPIELDMPSGAVWLVLPLNVPQFAVTGKLPLHLLAGKTLASATETSEEIANKLKTDDVTAILEMVRDAMLNNVVEPKITLEETEDSITPEMIDPEDFDFFMTYVMSGGQAAGGGQAQARSKSVSKTSR